MAKLVLWWGRSDVDYSRNRIVRSLFKSLGWQIVDFWPTLSGVGDLQARFASLPAVDLVWVPCFRQRDIQAASRWARKIQVPLVCDPLISAYDKQVLERKKYPVNSWRSKRLLRKESELFQLADYLVADTEQHAKFFAETLGCPVEKLAVLPVGAEESLFIRQSLNKSINRPLNVLFYGSFLALQGPEIIAQAIRLYKGPAVEWRFIGRGPLLNKTQAILKNRQDVVFSDWVEYTKLPNEIANADLCLGIFGETDKALRVIPNKFYQAVACGRPIITCESKAYPVALREGTESGIYWVPAGNAEALAAKVTELAMQPELLVKAGAGAFNSYQRFFSESALRDELISLLANVTSSTS